MANLAGRRFEGATVKLTISDYCDPQVQSWIKNSLMTRGAVLSDYRIALEIRA